MKKTTLLVIGDFTSTGRPSCPSFQRLLRYRNRLPAKFSRMEVLDYSTLLAGVCPKVYTKDIVIIMFFPYNYWCAEIEVYDRDDRVYGDKTFGKKFAEILSETQRILRYRYRGHRLLFVNNPNNIILDRDKKKTKQLLSKNGIPTPKFYYLKNVRKVKKLLNQGINLYVKPRFGAMGKGLTFLSKDRWVSNFRFRNNRLISRQSDYGWKFKNFTGNTAFLRKLLRRDFLFEKAIEPVVVERRRFDLRIYVVYREIPHLYARSNGAKATITNWAQGGRLEGKAFLKKRIPKDKIEEAKEFAIKTAKVLDFDFTGIDVLFSKGYENTYILEAHSFPGFERKFNLIRCLLNSI